MKKNILFMACCIGLMLMASCKKHVAPTITLMQGEGYLIENAVVYSNESHMIGFVANGEKLNRLETSVTKDGELVCSYPEVINGLDIYTTSFPISFDVTGNLTITCVVTDAEGMTATTSLNITCNEKPNAKFVGRYEGEALMTGTLHANITGMEPVDEAFVDQPMPIVLELEAGENINEVVGFCTFEDRTIECKGIVDEDSYVTFEALNDVFTFDYNLNGFTISPQINVTYNIKGMLNLGQLLLEGTCKGDGQIGIFGNVEMDATVGGSLDKTR